MPEMPYHAQLDGLGALLQIAADIGDQIVTLPVSKAAIALSCLPVVVRSA
jgi:hypothetical protein